MNANKMILVRFEYTMKKKKAGKQWNIAALWVYYEI